MSRSHPAREKLKGHPIVREFQPSELDELLDLSEPRRFAPGEAIAMRRDLMHSLFLLIEGRARAVFHQADGSEAVAATFVAGDVLGELGLLDCAAAGADLVADSECTVVTITMGLLRMQGIASPRGAFKLAMAVLELAACRLQVANRRYADSLDIVSALAAEQTVVSAREVA